ncbi:MAG: extracellular solute-binding protein, partial [Frankiales bacterium]|nr:extracellular solute-binding protein [Frankiales bacterium]
LDLYPGPVEAFTYDNELACLPTNASSTVAYVNEDLFARADVTLPDNDWTWTDLEAAAKALDAKDIPAVGFDVGVRLVAPFVWTAGGEIVDDTADPTRTTLDTAPGRRALSYLIGLQAYGVDATARAAADPADQFAAGRLAIYFDSRRAVPGFRKADLAFDVRPLPRAAAARPSASLLASDAYCVATASKSPRLAASLARFAAGGEGATVLARSGRTVPALRPLAQSEAFLDPGQRPRSSQVFLDVLPDLRRLPNVAVEDEAEELADDLLTQLFAGKAGLEQTAAAVDAATAEVYGRG